jgi:hypothetical protein
MLWGKALGCWCLALLVCARLAAAEPPIKPVRVSEALRDLEANDGKVVAVVGRYSFRESGRFLSEEWCEKKLGSADFVWPCAVRLVFDSKSAPKPPLPLEFDAQVVASQLKLVKEHTSLGKFRFGTPDYDRWAVVFGRLEVSKEYRSGLKPNPPGGLEHCPARLVCSGEGDIVLIREPQ